MMAVSRNTCISRSTCGREKIYYLLSIIYYLTSPPVEQTVFVRPLRLGLLFWAESVGASLEAPEKPYQMQSCKNPTKSRYFALIFRSAQRKTTGASSDAPTNFAFMLFIYGQTVQMVFASFVEVWSVPHVKYNFDLIDNIFRIIVIYCFRPTGG